MTRPRRLVLFAAIGVAGVFAAVAAALFVLVDALVGKARLEATASQALGMEFSIRGAVKIGFLPALVINLEDVRIRNRGADLASAQQASLAIDLLPLLRNDVRIAKVVLKHPTISIERGRDGRFNFETPQAAEESLPVLDWPIVVLSDATLAYADKRSGEPFEAGDCRLDLHGLRLAGGARASFLKNLAFTAEGGCAKAVRHGLTVSDLKFSVDAKSGVFDLAKVQARVFGTPGSGVVQADFSKGVPAYRVRFALPQFPVEEFFKTMSPRKVAAGRMDFSADFSMHGTTERAMRQTLKGQISLRGRDLTFVGSDLDREFARFESSQRFSLVDVGAFFFAGPLGLVVTKGFDFATLTQESSGSSEIRTLVSDWTIEHGVARARDVAMATKQNRIALQGGLDFVAMRFDDVTVALVDAKGCAKVRQHIRGTFEQPVVEKPNLLETLAGPTLRLLKKGGELLGGGRCDVFYAGSVAAPT